MVLTVGVEGQIGSSTGMGSVVYAVNRCVVYQLLAVLSSTDWYLH